MAAALVIRIAAQMAQAQAALGQLKGEISTLGPKFSQAGAAMTAAFTVPIVGTLGLAAKAAIDFESSFAGVRKTVDASAPEFAALAAGLRQMATETPTSVNELNKVAEAAGQLGIKKEDILQFTRTMADLGVTTNLTADEAATATAQIQNIFGAAGTDVDRFGATLVALGNAGASTEKDIINMGLRIAGAGNQVGLTQAQVLAFASGLSSVGINAEAGGSAISRVFLKINDAVAKGGEGMDEFARVAGVTSAQFKTAWEKDAAGATVTFIEGLARLKGEGENVNSTLEGLVGKNIILKDTLLRASGAGTLLRDQLALGNQAWQENSALTKEAAERYKTVESQLVVLKNKLMDAGITLGQALLPVIIDFVQAATPMIAKLAEAAKWFGELPAPVRMIALGFAGLVAAIGPLLIIVGQAATAFTAISAILGSAGLASVLSALIPFLGPAGLIAAGLIAIVAVWKNWDAIKETVHGVYLAVKEWMVDKFNAIVESIRSKVDAVSGFFRGMYDAVVGHSYVPEMIGGIAVAFASLQGVMVDPTVAATNTAAAAFEQLSDGTDALRSNLHFTAETIETDFAAVEETVARAAVSFTDAMALVSAGQGTMTGKIQADLSAAGKASTQRAWDTGTYYGPVVGGGPHNPHGTGPDFAALGYKALGGPVSGGMPYVVGERGPELFVPERNGSIVPNGGAGNITLAPVLNFNGPVIGSAGEFQRMVNEALLNVFRSTGRPLPGRA